ncbi:hypothetical protein [Paraburkholderia xenovorans]
MASATIAAVGSLAGGGAADISVQLSYRTSQSKNTFTEDQTTQTGSTVKAGGTALSTATGGGDGQIHTLLRQTGIPEQT